MDTRTLILGKALELFSLFGYDAVGIQTVAEASGVTKPTLYYYFGSKKGLLEALLDFYHQPLMNALSPKNHRENLNESLVDLASSLFDFAMGHPSFYRMLLAMYFSPPGSVPNQTVRSATESLHQTIEHQLGEFMNDPAYSRDRYRQHELAATFLGSVNTYIGLFLNGYIKLSSSLANRVAGQYLHGIHAQPHFAYTDG